MVRRAALVGISLLLTVTTAACADSGDSPAGRDTPSGQSAAFQQRAEKVAEAWRAADGKDAWRSGFVPLQDLTVPHPGATFTDATQQAFSAGWYELRASMPREAGGRTGAIRYPDGSTATVPLITRAEAYGELDQGDPPPCAGPTVPPAADTPAGQAPDEPGAPESPVAARAPKACATLTITAVTSGTVELLTSRGPTQVPAWLFSVRELGGTVARVAVAPSAIAPVPEIVTGQLPQVPGLVGAQDLGKVEGKRLSYRLGVGSCDEQIKASWYETADVVVVGGTAVRTGEVCTEQLILHPVQITLDQPLATRPVLDAVTGRVLTVSATATA